MKQCPAEMLWSGLPRADAPPKAHLTNMPSLLQCPCVPCVQETYLWVAPESWPATLPPPYLVQQGNTAATGAGAAQAGAGPNSSGSSGLAGAARVAPMGQAQVDARRAAASGRSTGEFDTFLETLSEDMRWVWRPVHAASYLCLPQCTCPILATAAQCGFMPRMSQGVLRNMTHALWEAVGGGQGVCGGCPGYWPQACDLAWASTQASHVLALQQTSDLACLQGG